MSSSSSAADTPSLSRIVSVVEGHTQTLSLYNTDAPKFVPNEIREHFETTSVEVRTARTEDSVPENFAVLHDDEQFVAASDLFDLHQAVKPTGRWQNLQTPRRDYPQLLTEIDHSVFKEYGKRRMILASRDIELQAWECRPSTLHVGFQEFSRLRTQESLYRKLTAELDVHLYGVPDWDLPFDSVTPHGYDTDEIKTHWFVVVEPPENAEIRPRALLAQEREPNVYSGFWTSQESIVRRILDRLEAAYPPS